MRGWRREHPHATPEHTAAKSAHFEACRTLTDAESGKFGTMPARMVEAVRRREVAARQALHAVESTSVSRSTPHPDLPLDRYLSQRSVHRINTEFPGVQLINEEPFVFLIHDFLSGDECASLLAATRAMEPRPSDRQEDVEQPDRRTSTSRWPPSDEVRWLRERIASATATMVEQLEPTKLSHYAEGQLFKKHSDASFLGEKMWAYAARLAGVDEDGVQAPCGWPSRFCTLFIYLNDVESGGRTRFLWLDGADAMPGAGIFAQCLEPLTGGSATPSTAASLSITPRAGLAVVHFPCTAPAAETGGDCIPDPRAMHESEPAVDDKFIVQQFVWPVSVDPDAAGLHEDVRREWVALLSEQGASASSSKLPS